MWQEGTNVDRWINIFHFSLTTCWICKSRMSSILASRKSDLIRQNSPNREYATRDLFARYTTAGNWNNIDPNWGRTIVFRYLFYPLSWYKLQEQTCITITRFYILRWNNKTKYFRIRLSDEVGVLRGSLLERVLRKVLESADRWKSVDRSGIH